MARHPYTSPLTYAKCEQLWAKRRKSNDFRRINYACRLYKNSAGNFAYVMHSTTIAVVEPDNTLTLNSGGWITSPTTKEEVGYVCGIGIWSNSKVNLEQTIRIGNLPWREGTRVRDRVVLDQHKHIDRKRVGDRKKMVEIQKSLQPLKTLAYPLLRFGVRSCDLPPFAPAGHVARELLDGEPSPDKVYAVVKCVDIGLVSSPDYEYLRKIFDRGLVLVRNVMYERAGVYSMQPIVA
jgi:hypothetical protein